jgi:hypothetical protein
LKQQEVLLLRNNFKTIIVIHLREKIVDDRVMDCDAPDAKMRHDFSVEIGRARRYLLVSVEIGLVLRTLLFRDLRNRRGLCRRNLLGLLLDPVRRFVAQVRVGV